MKIAFIMTGLGKGGAEKIVLNLAKEYTKSSHDVIVIALSNHIDNSMVSAFSKINISPLVFDFGKPFNILNGIFKIIKTIKLEKIDIVHLHLSHPVLLSPFLFFFTKVKIVFTSHSFNIGYRGIWVRLFKPFRNVDILFSERQYTGIYKKNHIIIPNGIDIEPYQIKCEKNAIFTFLIVGRLANMKNHLFAVQLMNNLINRAHKNCQLLIAGEGDMHNLIVDEINKYGLTDKILMLGPRNDINVIMAQCHCLILPSLWEGLPLVLLEAGASKLPVVATPVGAIPDILDRENSYICPLLEFEQNMLEVMEHYSLALQKAELFYQQVKERYTMQVMAQRHLSLYNNLLNIK